MSRPGGPFDGPPGEPRSGGRRRPKRGPPYGGLWGAAEPQAEPLRGALGAAFWLVARCRRYGAEHSVYREPNPIAVALDPIAIALLHSGLQPH